MQKISVLVPPLRQVPRAAVWAGEAAAWMTAALARRAADRAARHAARERAILRMLAARYEASQPEFAKDLYAAANDDRPR